MCIHHRIHHFTRTHLLSHAHQLSSSTMSSTPVTVWDFIVSYWSKVEVPAIKQEHPTLDGTGWTFVEKIDEETDDFIVIPPPAAQPVDDHPTSAITRRQRRACRHFYMRRLPRSITERTRKLLTANRRAALTYPPVKNGCKLMLILHTFILMVCLIYLLHFVRMLFTYTRLFIRNLVIGLGLKVS